MPNVPLDLGDFDPGAELEAGHGWHDTGHPPSSGRGAPWLSSDEIEQLPPPAEGYERVIGETGLVFDMPTFFGDDTLSTVFNSVVLGRTDPRLVLSQFEVLGDDDPIRQHLAHPERSWHFTGYALAPDGKELWIRFVVASKGVACVERWPLGSTVTEVEGVTPLGDVPSEDVNAAEAAGLSWRYKVAEIHLSRYYPMKPTAEWNLGVRHGTDALPENWNVLDV